jgi:hypothetical protein
MAATSTVYMQQIPGLLGAPSVSDLKRSAVTYNGLPKRSDAVDIPCVCTSFASLFASQTLVDMGPEVHVR